MLQGERRPHRQRWGRWGRDAQRMAGHLQRQEPRKGRDEEHCGGTGRHMEGGAGRGLDSGFGP